VDPTHRHPRRPIGLADHARTSRGYSPEEGSGFRVQGSEKRDFVFSEP
jgi:hypothetical protein